MKAIVYKQFGDRDVLDLLDVPDPLPKEGELLIEVERTSVNYVDIRERQGVYNRQETHVGGIVLPHVPGLQVAGRVIKAGSAELRRWEGKKVVAYTPQGGGYAQLATAQADFCVELSPSDDVDLYAALPNQGLTAYLMLTASTRIHAGDSVLVHGASGGVGSLAVQIARILGAGLVLGTAGSASKMGFVRELGVDDAINYSLDGWPQEVLNRTSGEGVNVLLESIGGEVFEQNFECLAPFGRYIVFGSTRGPGLPFAPRRLMQKAQTMTGFYLPVFHAKPTLIQEGLAFLVRAASEGKLKPFISCTLPLHEIAEAQRLLEDREVRGTVLIDVTSV